MTKHSSRLGGLQSVKKEPAKKTVSKVLQAKKQLKISTPVKSSVQSFRTRHGAALPVGGKILEAGPEMLDEETIDQLTHSPLIHALGSMDMPTFHMLQGIASNFLGVEHPMRKITKELLGGDFIHPKNISKISTRDIMKAVTPQQLGGALHSEWMDMLSGKLSSEELGGGLFSSLKMLAKKGIRGARTALSKIAKGAKGAVLTLSKGAMGAQMIGKSLSNAIMQGVEIANVLSPVVQTVFPGSKPIIEKGVGEVKAINELVKRGVNIAGKVEKGLQPVVQLLGPVDEPIVMPFTEEPVGAGLDLSNEDDEDTGPRFLS